MTTLAVTMGSDVRLSFAVSSNSTPIDLTGRTVEVLQASADIADRLSVNITSAAAGEFEVLIEGTDPIRLGRHEFRLQIGGAGDSIGLPTIALQVS